MPSRLVAGQLALVEMAAAAAMAVKWAISQTATKAAALEAGRPLARAFSRRMTFVAAVGWRSLLAGSMPPIITKAVLALVLARNAKVRQLEETPDCQSIGSATGGMRHDEKYFAFVAKSASDWPCPFD